MGSFWAGLRFAWLATGISSGIGWRARAALFSAWADVPRQATTAQVARDARASPAASFFNMVGPRWGETLCEGTVPRPAPAVSATWAAGLHGRYTVEGRTVKKCGRWREITACRPARGAS